jgi:hypothetical protein
VDRTARQTTVVSHNGGNGIYFADFRRYVDEGTVIIVLGNTPLIPATFVAMNRVEPLIFDAAAIAMPPALVDVPAATRAALAGDYTVAAGRILTIAATPEGLRADSADPGLVGRLHGFVPPGGRFAGLETKTAAIVAASANGAFQPFVEASAGRPGLAEAAAEQGRQWQAWREAFGAFEGFDLLGTTFTDGDPAIVVQLRFARGRTIARYPWGPRRLLDVSTERLPPVAEFLPESATSFVRFDVRRRVPVRLVFAPDAAGTRLTVTTDAGQVVATRPAAGSTSGP